MRQAALREWPHEGAVTMCVRSCASIDGVPAYDDMPSE